MSDARNVSRITLHALDGEPLADPAVRDMVLASARAIGERQGMPVDDIDADDSSVTLSINGTRIEALGFVAELRRLTDRWYREKFKRGSLWGEPPAREPGEP